MSEAQENAYPLLTHRRRSSATLMAVALPLALPLALLLALLPARALFASGNDADLVAVVLSRPAGDVGVWVVQGEANGADYSVQVSDATEISGAPIGVGARVRVRGPWIGDPAAGAIAAERVERIAAGDDGDGNGGNGEAGRVRGILRSRPAPPARAGPWVIECRPGVTCTVVVNDATLFDDEPKVGEYIEVQTSNQPDNSLIAIEVRRDDTERRELVVRLRPGINPLAFAGSHGLTLRSSILQSAGIYLFTTDDDEEDDVDEVSEDPRALWVEFNIVNSIPSGDAYKTWRWGGNEASGYINQNAFAQVHLPEALTVSQGAGQIVAVLDTGVHLGHPALAGRLLPGRDMVADDLAPQDEGPGFGWGHGSHVAGIVARMAPQAKILPVRVLDADGRGNTFTVAYAIEWSVAQGVDVINLSLGADAGSQVLSEAIAQAEAAGVVVVAAAGNEGVTAEQFPAAFDGVIGVASVDATNLKAPFSNYGDWVDLAAPGVGITSTVPFTSGIGYAAWSGTSMSTAFVSGAAALLLARGTAPAEVSASLRQSSADLAPLDPVYGAGLGGLLDAAAAVDAPRALTPQVFLPFAARR